MPGNIDLATQEIIQMAEDADPERRRTLGVLTKPDLIDHGAATTIPAASWDGRPRLPLTLPLLIAYHNSYKLSIYPLPPPIFVVRPLIVFPGAVSVQ